MSKSTYTLTLLQQKQKQKLKRKTEDMSKQSFLNTAEMLKRQFFNGQQVIRREKKAERKQIDLLLGTIIYINPKPRHFPFSVFEIHEYHA